MLETILHDAIQGLIIVIESFVLFVQQNAGHMIEWLEFNGSQWEQVCSQASPELQVTIFWVFGCLICYAVSKLTPTLIKVLLFVGRACIDFCNLIGKEAIDSLLFVAEKACKQLRQAREKLN